MDDKGKEHARQVLFTLAGVLGRGGGGMLAMRQWTASLNCQAHLLSLGLGHFGFIRREHREYRDSIGVVALAAAPYGSFRQGAGGISAFGAPGNPHGDLE